jgi:hypothetical protein
MGAVLVGLLAAGCSGGTEDTTTSSETTAPDSTTAVTAATTTTEAVIADASCVACHTDQATLQAMAVEPPDTESLSEGEG